MLRMALWSSTVAQFRGCRPGVLRVGVASQPAREQFAEVLEDRICSGGDMRIDPLEVTQHIEMQRARLDALHPTCPDAGEMRLRCACFEVAAANSARAARASSVMKTAAPVCTLSARRSSIVRISA